MDESTIKALMTLDTTIVNGRKVLQIPYEDILRGYISVRINTQQDIHTVTPPVTSPSSKQVHVEGAISIPVDIQRLYPSTKKDKMVQDVVDYLQLIAKCWEYRNLGFQPSLLKKAAKSKPDLNSLIYTAYGKDGDQFLTVLVKDNMAFIKGCWDETTV